MISLRISGPFAVRARVCGASLPKSFTEFRDTRGFRLKLEKKGEESSNLRVG